MKTNLIVTLTAFMAVMILHPQAGRAGASPDKAVIPNRTLPKVNPPKTGLEFSANPSAKEDFRGMDLRGTARSAW